jgi:hypothetical protein
MWHVGEAGAQKCDSFYLEILSTKGVRAPKEKKVYIPREKSVSENDVADNDEEVNL